MLIVITMFNIYVFCMLALRFGMSLTVTYFIKNDQKRLSTSNTSQSRSALACAFTCSLDSDCWSLSFNGVTGDCLLSDIKVKVIQDNWIEDVEWQTLSKTVKSIGNACHAHSDCFEINSICLENICFCNSTTKYNHATRSCDEECDNYSSAFRLYENISISGYNHFKTYLNLADCKQTCLDMGNACGSVDYSENRGECWPQTATYQQAFQAYPATVVASDMYSLYSRFC